MTIETNNVNACNQCSNAKATKTVVDVYNIRECHRCEHLDRCASITIETVCDYYIRLAYEHIAALLWLLRDDHKYGDTSNDAWTYWVIELIYAYIEYVRDCARNGIRPMSWEAWYKAHANDKIEKRSDEYYINIREFYKKRCVMPKPYDKHNDEERYNECGM